MKTIKQFGQDLDVTPKEGSYIRPDEWQHGVCLLRGDSFSTFRVPTSCVVITSIAVEIEITGRVVRRIDSLNMVRIKIIFPGDGEPDTTTGGFMEIVW